MNTEQTSKNIFTNNNNTNNNNYNSKAIIILIIITIIIVIVIIVKIIMETIIRNLKTKPNYQHISTVAVSETYQ